MNATSPRGQTLKRILDRTNLRFICISFRFNIIICERSVIQKKHREHETNREKDEKRKKDPEPGHAITNAITLVRSNTKGMLAIILNIRIFDSIQFEKN